MSSNLCHNHPMPSTPTRHLALDPGYDRLGWAIGDIKSGQVTLIACGCITTNKKANQAERYLSLDQQLSQLITTHQPTQAVIETLFFSSNKTTALKVAEARGVILSCLVRHHLTYTDINPMTVKVAVTGYGQADKAAVTKMVKLQLGSQLGSQLAQTKLLDDTLDALAMLLSQTVSGRLKG
jgi:crossover junction endodeoxyribonuclease RuvC